MDVVEGKIESFFPVSLYKTWFLLLDSVMEAERFYEGRVSNSRENNWNSSGVSIKLSRG